MGDQFAGFYNRPMNKRVELLKEAVGFTEEEIKTFVNPNSLSDEIADHMIENVVGRFALPIGLGLNFLINSKEYVIPMVVEEASVVAAASHAAKLARSSGGFFASYSGSVMISQIQLVDIPDPYYAAQQIYENKEEILKLCNDVDPILVKFGGGALDVECRVLDSFKGKMLIVHLKVNTLDAMGANAVNSMAEKLAPMLEKLTGGRVFLRILSNLAVHRLARSRAVFSKEVLGEDVIDSIMYAYAFAAADPFRATTHNKGIMNGVIPVVMATGNDTRAIESGAHAYASISGVYRPLTVWEKNADGDLVGTIELPMAVGLIGGATKVHPQARLAVKMMGVTTAEELAKVIASVGLAQNFAAVRALATEGIQRGHMSLHARNLAATAGASGELLTRIVEKMIQDKNVKLEYAMELVEKLKDS